MAPKLSRTLRVSAAYTGPKAVEELATAVSDVVALLGGMADFWEEADLNNPEDVSDCYIRNSAEFRCSTDPLQGKKIIYISQWVIKCTEVLTDRMKGAYRLEVMRPEQDKLARPVLGDRPSGGMSPKEVRKLQKAVQTIGEQTSQSLEKVVEAKKVLKELFEEGSKMFATYIAAAEIKAAKDE